MTDIIPDNRNIAEAVSLWDSGIEFAPGSNTYKLVAALLGESDRIDEDLEDIHDQTHINTATGENLDKIGSLVDVDRESGEGDDRYRARIKGEFRAATIDTTFDEFVEFVVSVLETQVSNLTITTSYDSNPAQVNVAADPAVYDSVDLSNQDVVDLLGGGVPAGHEVRVLEGGTFRLKADGDGDDPAKGLTADGISTGGTLAADIV